ncbi:ionotropic receptor 93a-like [Procambarus clarkii]|uniref:ionotropic receptor 93a-like n=1 Tax=Procambarus clarkii TaxID=6728 RepID=UPI003741FA4D
MMNKKVVSVVVLAGAVLVLSESQSQTTNRASLQSSATLSYQYPASNVRTFEELWPPDTQGPRLTSTPTVCQLATKVDFPTRVTVPLHTSSIVNSRLSSLPGGVSWLVKHSTVQEESLVQLVSTIIHQELRECVLVLAADTGFWSLPLMDHLATLPNLRQIVKVAEAQEPAAVLWTAQQCRGYLLLLSDPAPLYTWTNTLTGPWDYSGRFVVVGLSRDQLDGLIQSKKGRKTVNIVGLVQGGEAGQYEVLASLMYQQTRLVRVFTWRPGSSSTLTLNLFPDKVSNLHGALLNVITFEFPPSVMYQRSRNGTLLRRYGPDMDVVATLAHVFNFTTNILEPPAGEMWGDLTQNGTWNGMVGLFGRGEGDIGVANLFITDLGGRGEFQEYSAYYDQEVRSLLQSTCFIIQREAKIPRFQSLVLPFTPGTWLAVLGALLLAGPLLHCLAKLSLNSGERLGQQSLVYASLYTWGMHFRYTLRQEPSTASLQVYVVFLGLYVIVITTGYCSNLTAFLTVERTPPGINTIKQLYSSSLTPLGLGNFFGISMAESKSEYLRGLSSRFVSVRSFEDISPRVVRGEAVMIQTRRYHEYSMIHLTTSWGLPQVRIMKECFMPFNVAIGLQSHSPLKTNFDRVVSWISQSGLVNYWFKQALLFSKQSRVEEGKTGSGEEGSGLGVVSLTLQHLQAVFTILALGWAAGLLIFSGELFFPARQNTK